VHEATLWTIVIYDVSRCNLGHIASLWAHIVNNLFVAHPHHITALRCHIVCSPLSIMMHHHRSLRWIVIKITAFVFREFQLWLSIKFICFLENNIFFDWINWIRLIDLVWHMSLSHNSWNSLFLKLELWPSILLNLAFNSCFYYFSFRKVTIFTFVLLIFLINVGWQVDVPVITDRVCFQI
jgi:hypothetical protein